MSHPATVYGNDGGSAEWVDVGSEGIAGNADGELSKSGGTEDGRDVGGPMLEIWTLLLTDLVDSTRMTSVLGDRRSAEVYAAVDRAARAKLSECGGREIERTDGHLFVFRRPVDAARCALSYHSEMRRLSGELGMELRARVGIHLGEVLLGSNTAQEIAAGAKQFEVEGLSLPTVARVMGLAQGGQTLLSRGAFDLARRAAVGDDAFPPDVVRWLAHGPYSMKGLDEAVEVCEVGEAEHAPLTAPPDSDKARSVAPIDVGIVTGWRPAPGAAIPSAPGWVVLERLGEGGFGEVWRAQRTGTGGNGKTAGVPTSSEKAEISAFKFCFDLAHARALRREATLLAHLMKSPEIRNANVVRLLDYQLKEAPLYLRLEYIAGKNLAQWLREEGTALKPVQRLQMMSQVGRAIGEIHRAGVIVNDIKPSNILVRYLDGGKRDFLITDLGIGQIREKGLLKKTSGDRTTGFTKTWLTVMAPATPGSGSAGGGSGAGTLVYMAPEIFEGQPATMETDAYAFGVTLMQVAAGDPTLAVAEHWRRHVRNRPARKLIGQLLRGNPRSRPNMFRVASVLRMLRRRTWMRRARLAAAILPLLVFAGILVYRDSWLAPYWRARTMAVIRESETAGLPITLESWNKRYAGTKAGQLAVSEAAWAIGLFVMPNERLKQSIWSKPPQPTKEGFNLMKVLHLNSGLTSASVNFDYVRLVVADNKVALDRLLLLSSVAPWREYGWVHNLTDNLIFDRGTKLFSSSDGTGSFLSLRECTRILLPTAIYLALEEGNPKRAYELLENWMLLSRARAVGSTNLVGVMIRMAMISPLNSSMDELVSAVPPSRAVAMRLAELLEQSVLEEEYLRGVELETLFMLEWLRYAAGERKWPPRALNSTVEEMPQSFQVVRSVGPGSGSSQSFADRAVAFVKRLTTQAELVRLRQLSAAYITSKFPRFGKAEFWECSSIYARSPILISQLLRTYPLKRAMELGSKVDRDLELDVQRNFATSIMLPGVLRAAFNARGAFAQASLRRAMLLMRVAEIDAGGDPSKMPQSMQELATRLGVPIPHDPLGDTPETSIIYEPNQETGTFILRHRPNLDKFSGDKGGELRGIWNPEHARAGLAASATAPAGGASADTSTSSTLGNSI